jgi:hypothetical protein
MFPSSGASARHFATSHLDQQMSPSLHLKKESHPVSATFSSNYLDLWAMEKVQNRGDSESSAPSSEPFRYRMLIFYLK